MNAHSAFSATPVISAEERASRKAAVDFARGSIRFEGGILSREVEALNTRYIAGEITSDDLTAGILELYKPAA